MPSGAKKRKASKRKVDNNNNYATHSTVAVKNQSMNGDDEIKQVSGEEGKLERRESVRSNVSEKNLEKEVIHDGENDKVSNTGSEKDGSSDSSSEGSSGSSSDSDEESRVVEEVEDLVKETEDFESSEQATVNLLEGNLQKDVENDGGDVEIENSNGQILTVESEKDVHATTSSSKSSASSSDDESTVIEKVETSPPVNSSEEIDSVPEEVKESVKETVEIVDPDKNVIILDYAIESDDSSSDEEKAVDSNKPVQKETKETDTVLEKLSSSIESDTDVQEKTVVETAPAIAVAEIDVITPDVEPTRSDEFNHYFEETKSVLASINVPMANKTMNLFGSDSAETVSNETVEKSSLSTDDIAESQNEETNHTVAVPITENESDNHEPPESRPLLDSARRTMQTTSWKSCCGIFDLFNGGNRY